jgi:hypothetical protein
MDSNSTMSRSVEQQNSQMRFMLLDLLSKAERLQTKLEEKDALIAVKDYQLEEKDAQLADEKNKVACLKQENDRLEIRNEKDLTDLLHARNEIRKQYTIENR